MQGAQFATSDLIHERRPFCGDDIGSWVFVAREAGGSEQFFKEGRERMHREWENKFELGGGTIDR
jgi:hypothetical protein